MKQSQLLTFGLKVFYNSTFTEVHKQLEPLWRNLAKRKHEIQFTSKSVAELLVYEQQTQLLILRLENSRLLFSKQISSLNKQANDKDNNKSMKLSMERSRLLKDAINALRKGNKVRYLQLQEVMIIAILIFKFIHFLYSFSNLYPISYIIVYLRRNLKL